MKTQPTEAIRIQLEGDLEVVEALAARWHAVAGEFEADVKLEGTSWYGLAEEDAAAAHAVAELERRAGEHPLLTQLRADRERVLVALRRHAATLGLSLGGTDACTVLNDLKTKQPLTTMHFKLLVPRSRLLTSQAASFAFVLFISGISSLTWDFDWQHLTWAAATIGIIGYMARKLRNSPPVRTPRDQSLTIAGDSLRLPGLPSFDRLTSVRWSRSGSPAERQTTSTKVHFRFAQQPEITLVFEGYPDELLGVLRGRGVPVVEGTW